MSAFANRPDEASVVREVLAGSADAFLQLISAYDGAVLNLALRTAGSGEQARHIYCKVFLKLHHNLGSLRPDAIRTWIYRQAAQVCLEHLRQAWSTGGEFRLGMEPLDRALRTLTPRERMALELRLYDRLHPEAVGEALDTTAAGARNALARAIGRLRSALASTSEGPGCTEF
jgi:RNA polymerase sigma-70 factor (ECF subfamily)